MFCDNCGTELKEGQTVCPSCGVSPEPLPEEAALQPPDTEPGCEQITALAHEPADEPAESPEPQEEPVESPEPQAEEKVLAFTPKKSYMRQRLGYPQGAAGPKVRVLRRKSKVGILIALGILLALFAAGVRYLAIPLFRDIFSPERRLEKTLEQRWILSDPSVRVLLVFTDGSGRCMLASETEEEPDTVREFSYEIADEDTIDITYHGSTKQYDVTFGDDRQTMRLSPQLLNVPEEEWQAMDKDSSPLHLWDGLLPKK